MVQNSSDSATGRNTGAVFAFTMGYNLEFANSWLIGAQTEVSRNLVKTRMVGTSTSNQSSTTSGTSFGSPFFLPQQITPTQNANNFSTNSTAEHQLSNDWTISVLARLGALATQEWLVYGLVGWSASGFELDNFRPFTLNGFTYGFADNVAGGVDHLSRCNEEATGIHGGLVLLLEHATAVGAFHVGGSVRC